MKNFFKDFLLDSVFVSMLTIVAGILVTVFHSMALDIISILLGCFAVVLGIINIVKYFRQPTVSRYNLLTGLIFGSLGVNVIIYPDTLKDFVAVVCGILILYHGIVNCENAIALKKAGYQFWYMALIFALITVIAGILLIVLKNVFIDSLALTLGIILIVEGTLNTWTAIKVRKNR